MNTLGMKPTTPLHLLLLILALAWAAPTYADGDRSALLKREKQLRAKYEQLLKRSSLNDLKVQKAISDHAYVLFQLAEYKSALKQYKLLQKGQFKALERDSEHHVHTGLRIAECYAATKKERRAKKAIETILKYCRSNYGRKDKLRMLGQIAYTCHGMRLFEESGKAY